MELFAHNGVDHVTTTEADTHSASTIVLTTLLVTVAVAILAGLAVYAVNRFALSGIRIKNREDD